ncbi:hypothetical protein [Marinagarivorans cellulosilyticus]|uniref:hypothetical protein n=1 Tax=Marinagarivorans cellulosilyticus TaxID=2721545 RepID=UPI001F1FF3A8|nr:hypothetical protein [Marinagarivorans cellulosilyticus]
MNRNVSKKNRTTEQMILEMNEDAIVINEVTLTPEQSKALKAAIEGYYSVLQLTHDEEIAAGGGLDKRLKDPIRDIRNLFK